MTPSREAHEEAFLPMGFHEEGFSLLEALVSLAIFSIIMVGAFTLFATSNKIFYRGQSRVESQQNARTAIEAMAREIRMAGYDSSGVIAGLPSPTGIQTASANSITFDADLIVDGTLDQVTYQRSGTTLVRSISTWNGGSFPAAVSGEIAGGLSSLTFSYFDSSNVAIPAPVASGSLGSIERVTISLQTTQTTSGQQANFGLVQDVKIRN